MNDDILDMLSLFVESISKAKREEYCWNSKKENCCNCRFNNFDIPKEETYDSKEFIAAIFDIGGRKYIHSLEGLDVDPILLSVREKIFEELSIPYVIVRKQESRIAIAVPEYIKDAPEKIANILGIIPEAFIEVSGPQSTVLIIDCEKEWLRSKYLGIGEEEWLL